MVRVLIFVVLLALLSIGATYVMDLDGVIRIEDSQFLAENQKIAIPYALAALFVFILLTSALLSSLIYLFFLPRRFRRSIQHRRHEKGLDAVKKSVLAINSGDAKNAFQQAQRAERFLEGDSLPLLLIAQSAQVAGKRDIANKKFQSMLKLEDSRLAGLRGLYVEAKRDGKIEESQGYAQEAVKLAPGSAWATEALLSAQCQWGNWHEAGETLDRRMSLGLIDRTTGKRQKAVLMAAEARSKQTTDPVGATKLALSALGLAPNLVPAAALAGRLLVRNGQYRKASKLLEKTWVLHPHPELARIYINMYPSNSAVDRCNRAKYLAERSNYSVEGRQAVAKTHIDAREFSEARKVLEPLLKETPTVNFCLLMAAIEHSELGAEGSARAWIAQAAHAPRDPVWIADGVISEQWEPVSPITGTIDAFVWKAPPDSLDSPLLHLGDPVLGDLDDQQKTLPISAPQEEEKDQTSQVTEETEIMAQEASKSDASLSVKPGAQKEEAALLQENSQPSVAPHAVEQSVDEIITSTSVDVVSENKQLEPDTQVKTALESITEKTITPSPVVSETLADNDESPSLYKTDKEETIAPEDAPSDNATTSLENSGEEDKTFPFARLPDDPGPDGDGVDLEPKPTKKWFGIF